EPRLHAMRQLSASMPLTPMTIKDGATGVDSKGKEKNVAVVIDRYSQIASEFESRMVAVFEEIFDPAVSFRQSDNDKNCKYCPFLQLCGRRPSDY
ncbi:MAG: PD-(D/E)XK nuclease family protein, partial [Muribaculaceae bacterium]|nr:PD-(D/E)XK nuclease family protein [Muribaculaceae bacterium]